jgi:hypothetical protein
MTVGAALTGVLVGDTVVGELEVGEVVSGRHWVSVPRVPTWPAGQLHAEAPLRVRMVLEPQLDWHLLKDGTPQMLLEPLLQKSAQLVTLSTLQAVRLPLKE